jgi:hypothetical protein
MYMSKPAIYRQGDVLLQKVEQLPSGAKLKKDNIILRGEATGHAHRVENGRLYEAVLEQDKFVFRPETRMFVIASKETRIVHEEHGPIELEVGIYIIIRQREYGKENQYILD